MYKYCIPLLLQLFLYFPPGYGQEIEISTHQLDSAIASYQIIVLSKEELENPRHKGLKPIKKIDDGRWICSIHSSSDDTPDYKSTIEQLGNDDYQWKIPKELGDFNHKSISVEVVDNQLFKEYLQIRRISFSEINEQVFIVQIDSPKQLGELAELPVVTYLSDESTNYMLESKVLDLNLVPNGIARIKNVYPDLTGASIVAHVKEPPINPDDLDLLERVKVYAGSAAFNNHATAMATIIGGSGLSSPRGEGVAKEVSLVSTDISDIFPNESAFYIKENVSVENHSYGTEIENYYGIRAAAFDQHLRENRHLVTIFSAGNQGQMTTTSGKYAGLSGVATITGNFKMAKNALVVGAVDTTGQIVPFNSMGPAYDGRIKPDLVAYSMEGTSNAAAITSGVSVLLQEYYKQNYGHLPSSDLIKALLVGGADDLGLDGPDFKTGFGNLNALQSMEMLDKQQFFQDSIDANSTRDYSVLIPENCSEVKVTLTWTDRENRPNSEVALVNDLDLIVFDDQGRPHLPWVLNTSPDHVNDMASRGTDSLNNVEQVLIINPKPGMHQIQVRSQEVLDNQKYAITYRLAQKGTFAWAYPFEKANMPYDGETVGYIRWASHLLDQKGTLYYSLGGDDWQMIEEVDLKSGSYRWDPPPYFGQAQLKMVIANDEFLSDSFIISRQLNFKPAFACADSMRFEYSTIDGVNNYELELFDGSGTKRETLFSPTGVTFDFNQLNGIVVRPTGTSGEEYISSDYLRAADFSGSCYLNSFYSEIQLDTGIVVHAELGSTYQISQVELLRDDMVVDLLESNELGGDIKLIDQDPLIGLNQHQIKIYFKNDLVILSDELPSYFLPPRRFLIYPNPAKEGGFLNILQASGSTDFHRIQITDMQSRMVKTMLLEGESTVLELNGLNAGVYLYRIIGSDFSETGKIIIE